MKKKKKKKRIARKDNEHDFTEFDNFLKKYGIFILVGFGILSYILTPETWDNIGENIWVALPVIGILAFYSLLSGDNKQPFNLVGLGFIVIILLAAIIVAF